MDVYLVPASRDRCELYCEVAVVAPASEGRPSSFSKRLTDVFRRAVAEGEAHRTGTVDEKGTSRLRRTITRKLAEAVAEQRLLWRLRRESSARLLYPDDIEESVAMATCRASLLADRDKHRRWCVIDGLLTLASAPVALVPGPNFLAYYFVFRTVGHYFSMRGAARGLDTVSWAPVASPHLTALRAVLPLAPELRSRRVDEIARDLGLENLGLFVNSVADLSSHK